VKDGWKLRRFDSEFFTYPYAHICVRRRSTCHYESGRTYIVVVDDLGPFLYTRAPRCHTKCQTDAFQ
jgi:hypothetical protein